MHVDSLGFHLTGSLVSTLTGNNINQDGLQNYKIIMILDFTIKYT